MNSQIISFNCILKNNTGQIISTTYNRDVLTTSNNPEDMLVGLTEGLKNVKKGERRTISLSAPQAYGFYDPKKVILFPKSKLPKHSRVGQTVSIMGKSGALRVYRILEFHNEMVSLDGNHPLAGQDLIFEIEALTVREATDEEIESAKNSLSSQLLH